MVNISVNINENFDVDVDVDEIFPRLSKSDKERVLSWIVAELEFENYKKVIEDTVSVEVKLRGY